jgi:RNA polymerase sigma-70 factor (ECF subfamily)
MKQDLYFKETFDRCFEVLCLYAARLSGDAEGAEDVVQEAFVKWWEAMKRNPGAASRAYLYRTVRNACVDRLRGPREMTVSVEEVAEELEGLFETEREEDGRAEGILEAVDSLPEGARRVFLAVCVEGRKYREVAGELNVSINTVKTQLARGLRLLRERVGRGEG